VSVNLLEEAVMERPTTIFSNSTSLSPQDIEAIRVSDDPALSLATHFGERLRAGEVRILSETEARQVIADIFSDVRETVRLNAKTLGKNAT
jgi:hypothetical protein